MLAESGSGHALVIDGPPDHGGRNLGVRPMEMLLLGLGGHRMEKRLPSTARGTTTGTSSWSMWTASLPVA